MSALVVPIPDGSVWRAPSLASADRERVRFGGFETFARLALPHVPGVSRPLWGWHLSEICTHVEALYAGACGELIANLPPGHVKSTLVSVLKPAWIWTDDPTYQFMGATYDLSLSRKLAKLTLDLMRSRWYVERWGDLLVDDGRNVLEYWTVKNGYRYSTACPGGRGTGRHCNDYTIDDPSRAQDAFTGTGIPFSKINDWIGANVLTRARPGEPQRVTLNMQRLHEQDAAGYLLDAFKGLDSTVHLMFPYKFERDRRCVTPFGGDRRTVEGERLWSVYDERGPERLAKIKGGWHGQVMRAQYQQDPRAGDDAIFRAPFKRFSPKARDFRSGMTCISVDPTFTNKEASDFVAIEVWGYQAGDFLCYYSEAVRRGFASTVEAILRIRAAWPAINILIEASANGHAIIEQLSAKLSGVIGIPPRGSKVARAQAASYHFGRVYFSEDAPWFEAKARNLIRFPGGAHDDDVDTTSQAVLWLATEFGGAEDFEAAMAEFRAERAQVPAPTRRVLGYRD